MRKLLMLVGLAVFALSVFAQDNKDLPKRPSPPELVNDFANVLSAGEVQQLERKLDAYDDSTSTQIAIVILPTISEDDISDFSFRLINSWGIGRKQKDNGVLITIDMQAHHAFIATGKGVEGAIPDVTARTIIDNYITPDFRQQNYYQGLDQATTAIMQALAGEFKGDQTGKDYSGYFILGFIILIIFLSIIFRNRGGGGGYYSSGGFWPLLFLGGGGGGFDGGGGGGFGGGFGGFGGGGSGGGGAGGSW